MILLCRGLVQVKLLVKNVSGKMRLRLLFLLLIPLIVLSSHSACDANLLGGAHSTMPLYLPLIFLMSILVACGTTGNSGNSVFRRGQRDPLTLRLRGGGNLLGVY